jgi:hypothetical protein
MTARSRARKAVQSLLRTIAAGLAIAVVVVVYLIVLTRGAIL